ncbi:MAG TPA: hypothetical protein VNU92_03640 [Edaphobacter sp.]|jgi:hypothetical protein|nr:hypothetical protein [Edaphobacter sp.]
MLLLLILALFFQPTPKSLPPHLPPAQLNDIATILAHDEGWPLGNPDYTLDPMTPDTDDGFDSIGVYKKAHLVRMYSINRSTGQIVDFMRGCQVFRFPNLEHFEQNIRSQTKIAPLTDQQLAKKVGCFKLSVVNTRWVKTP